MLLAGHRVLSDGRDRGGRVMTSQLNIALAEARQRELQRAAGGGTAARALLAELEPRRAPLSERLAGLWAGRPRRSQHAAACCAS